MKGPWFPARFDSECDDCGEEMEDGDKIRADGEGGYICSECGEDDEDEDLESLRDMLPGRGRRSRK